MKLKLKLSNGEEGEFWCSPQNGRLKRFAICQALGVSDVDPLYVEKYKGGMSSHEIAEWVKAETTIPISPRSIMRIVEKYTPLRGAKESFRNAIERGRVKFQLQEYKKMRESQLAPALRRRIMERDNYTCQLCGGDRARGAYLQVDHIVARVNGGSDDETNLRVLCLPCNAGKRDVEGEHGFGKTLA